MSVITPSLHEMQTDETLEISIHANINKNVTCLKHMDTLCNSFSHICVCLVHVCVQVNVSVSVRP